LEAKYGINSICTLEQALGRAGNMTAFAGGVRRAVENLKNDIVRLYFTDKLLTETGYVDLSLFKDKTLLNMCMNENLAPLADKIKSLNGFDLWIDYTPSRVLTRRDAIRKIDGAALPGRIWCTISDDNIGMLPQIMTDSIHEIMKDMKGAGIRDYFINHNSISNLEPLFEYISRVSWEAGMTPDESYRQLFIPMCGEKAGRKMVAAMHVMEDVTKELEWHGIGLTFPTPIMMERQFKSKPDIEHVKIFRDGYGKAAVLCREALTLSKKAGRDYIGYWIGRLDFAMGYMDILEEVKLAGAYDEITPEYQRHLLAAIDKTTAAIETYSSIASNRCDHGSIMALNEFVYRFLKSKIRG
jgi:hypothetical protein